MTVGALVCRSSRPGRIYLEYYYGVLLFNAQIIPGGHATFLIERHDGEHMPYHVYYRQAPVEKNAAISSIVLAWDD